MRFGFFDQLPCASGFTEHQRYKDILAQIELGDDLGFDTAWLGELHFSRAFSILADPLMVLAAAGQRTRRIRLGTAVALLPLHNPVKIIEEAATADILSDGRLEFGVGRGAFPLYYVGFDVPQEESRERFEEALDFILAAWKSEQFSFEGKYFRARDLCLIPRTLQVPHPPVRVAANSPETFPFAGRRGLPIFAAPLINPPERLKAGLQAYREALPTSAEGDTALAFSVHVTTSRAQARQETEPGLLRFLREAGDRPQLRGVPPSARPHRAGPLRGCRERNGHLRRSRFLRRTGARPPARIRDGRVHLLFQPGRDHGPCLGKAVDDVVRQGGHAALPVVRDQDSGLPRRPARS